jgi:hypothetical protein
MHLLLVEDDQPLSKTFSLQLANKSEAAKEKPRTGDQFLL